MDSRMNFGEGLPIPQEIGLPFMGSWIPPTPGKPIPSRSNSMLVDRHGNQMGRINWQEPSGVSSGYVQEALNYNPVAQHFSQIDQLGRNGRFDNGSASLSGMNRLVNRVAGAYTQAFSNQTAGWNSNSLADLLAMNNAAPNTPPSRSMSMAARPLIPNSHSQGNNWRESNSHESFLANQTRCLSSNLSSSHNSSSQISHYGFPVPYCQNYNLNSPPLIEVDAASSVSFQFTPVTPDPAKKLRSNELSTELNLSSEKISNEESNKQQDLVISTEGEANQHNSDELLHNIVDSSTIISTAYKEPKNPDRGIDQVIDLNKTPQQKPPKRRKHRPKVIVEVKPKKTPKTATTKITNSKEKPNEKRKYVRKKGLQDTQQIASIEETAPSTGKRKYVRKKGLKESAVQHSDSIEKTTGSSAGAAAKSCRRALNIDLENTRDESEDNAAAQQEMQNKKRLTFNLSTGFKAAESSNGANMCKINSALQISQQNGLLVENQQSGAIGNLNTTINQLPGDHIPMSERLPATAHLAPLKDMQMDNLNVNARETHRSMQQHIPAGVGQIFFPAKTDMRTRQVTSWCNPQSVAKIIPSLTENRGSKREYCHMKQTSICTANPVGSSLLHQEKFQKDAYHQNGSISGASCSETHKRKKFEAGIQTNTHGMLSCVAAVQDSRSQSNCTNNLNVVGPTSQRSCEMMNSQFESDNAKQTENNGIRNFAPDWYVHRMPSGHNLSKQHISSEPHSCIERMGETNRSNQVHNFASPTTTENHNMLPPTPPKTVPAPEDWPQPKTCNNEMSRKHQATGSTLSKSVPSGKDGMPQERKDVLRNHQQLPAKRRGRPAKQKLSDLIDELTYQMEGLSLNERTQNALVPYKGDGMVVPYDGFEFIKKRKQRPKVDLDPETERVWKLLMWKDGSEGLEGTDKEKEKWWEEERKVFRGRVDSFIARMHLVQGDRRFSKWKGSVVDSVIGVFLTQNVSDHLSSSAFMSLAALFPLKSRRNRTCDWAGTSIFVKEPDVCILNPIDTIKRHEKLLSYPVYNQSSMKPHESTEHQRDCENSWTERTFMVEAHSHSLEEEVLSSQDSFDSSIIQTNGGVRSYSGSNSEVEDPATGYRPNKSQSLSFMDLLQMEESSPLFEEFFSCGSESSLFPEGSRQPHQPEIIENGQQRPRLERLGSLSYSSTFNQKINNNNPRMQAPVVASNNYQLHQTAESQPTAQSEVQEVKGHKLHVEERISSWPSTASRFRQDNDANCTSRWVGQGPESMEKTTTRQYGPLRYQETPRVEPHVLLSKQTVHEESISQPHHSSQLHERNKTLQLGRSVVKPVNLGEALAERQNSWQHTPNIPNPTGKVFDVEQRITSVNKQTHLEHNLAQQNSKEQVHSKRMQVNTEASANRLKARKQKSEGVKKDAVDWDSLRRQVEATGRKERSEDTMDSLDYEAMRCTSTEKISQAIKARGMNNMLAERIKEFLDRLVREHGSIDLEWLRDVPPEKAKDYLLSIRGLGLKSVECVRLLTLHHLAFPVDTNVGRIAVRLGWVPLQPLPESLQLHLLELYPILESIQKYLWPRLCKLDQRTLYELHYQMITFGKVFCTKNRPNCNACPMRAECRHFASAFASARLALPGPEEKSIATSTFPVMAERNPGIVINPMPLPPPENNSLKSARFDIGSCVPIVEEPATPDQEHTEVTESDIEDTFDEDPDEIPTIKLNMEEFTVNLQNYMQSNMELQEGDMSKALVALNPDATSIPTPKLKNVSRLRTEHQVYELPDSHPLLKGMDRREPDDPSPYLLAIWTPGETANSSEPPDRQCQSQEPDKLCNEKTCFSCNSIREANSQTVRGTLLIPCRTAMRGSFPLNGTYFQVNEVFADHESSLNPIDVPRAWIWNLPRRIVYFGTSVSTIFKGLSTEGIQYCFWKGFVCVRGFDQQTRAPRPLKARLHFSASRLAKTKNEKE